MLNKIAFLLLVLALPFAGLSQTATPEAILKVSGEVKTPLSLTKDDLAKMKRTGAILKDRDGKEVPYTGVALQDVLEMAGVTLGRELRGENLVKYVLVKCADGYEVLFSLAEIDKGFTDRVIILADESMGKPLPVAKGPFRIIVPGEKVPARSSFQVVEIVIAFAKD
ncbi:MAG: molybdopterin-binding protein [Chitinophagaceae bacterium]|nr:MAG: molybdopterin-binding protein [Chitinophagaceae bacterium]